MKVSLISGAIAGGAEAFITVSSTPEFTSAY